MCIVKRDSKSLTEKGLESLVALWHRQIAWINATHRRFWLPTRPY